MSVWLVVTYLTHVIAVVGPLPYGMAECEARAQELRGDGSLDIAPGATVNGRPVSQSDIAVSCVQQVNRPEMTQP